MPQLHEKIDIVDNLFSYLEGDQALSSNHKKRSKKYDTSDGHRNRLREKFKKTGFTGFHDYEILELLLFLAIPRRDTKPLAKELLDNFKSLEAVLSASYLDITKIKGGGPQVYFVLKLFYETSFVISREKINKAPLLLKWEELSSYLQLRLGHLTHEEFHVLFLDTQSYLIHEMKMFRGTVDEIVVYPREIIKHALECGAKSIILAHNHPSGHPNPSYQDIQLTYNIIKAADLMKISILDHIVVGKYDVKSFKQLNLL